ncbi:MAG: hypothetical protein LCH89_06750 [Proteobacteria bacterium]|nr:hypothetical protein [Pseudomonadota bacterium]
MLIFLSQQLENELKTEYRKSEQTAQAIQNIAQARAQGDHIISGDATCLEYIISLKELNQSTKNIFQIISNEQSQIGSLHKNLEFYVEINSLNNTISKNKNSNQTIIEIPLHRFSKNDLVQPTFLIGENLLDCHLYLTYSRWLSRSHWNQRLPSKLNAILIPGGGDTTEKLLNHLSQDGRYFSLCLTDSDIKYPGGNIGETTKKCQKLTLKEISHHLTIPVRASENLLSPEQIHQVLNIDHTRNILLNNLKKITRFRNTDAWLYFPLKEGIRPIIGPHQKNSRDEYWQITAYANDSLENEFLYPGISTDLLKWTVDYLKNYDPEKIKDSNLISAWTKISTTVIAWTCASEPIRA